MYTSGYYCCLRLKIAMVFRDTTPLSLYPSRVSVGLSPLEKGETKYLPCLMFGIGKLVGSPKGPGPSPQKTV